MKESSTYQAILEEGAILASRKLLRVFGDETLGPPDASTATALEQIEDLARIEELCKRLPSVGSWQGLLTPPTAEPRRRRRRRSP